MSRIALIGAGLAGITAARYLAESGHDVVVFEKSRGVGGRMSTRRADALQFDHGAQYFTVRDAAFDDALSQLDDGVVASWNARVLDASTGEVTPLVRWVATPAMNSLVKAMAEGLDVRIGARVATMVRHDSRLRLLSEDGTNMGTFEKVVCTAPAPQSADLIEEISPETADRLRAEVDFAPAWAAMLAFDTPLAPRLPCDAILDAEGPLSWIARNASKPGRPVGETWVVHASPRWSEEFLELSADDAIARLLDHMAAHFEAMPRPSFAAAHRWRYALVTRPLGQPCLPVEDVPGLVLAGDWCLHGRVEGAFLSGLAAAKSLLEE